MKTFLLAFMAILSLVWGNLRKENAVKTNYVLDSNKSVVEWSGASPQVTHQGSFAVNCTALEVVDGEIKGGTFVIPIATLKNFDLPKTIRPVLIKHLKSKDFFHAALYPEATFSITNIAPLTNFATNAVPGANALVSGNFTLLGNTKPLSFPAKINLQDDSLAVEAKFKLDRTQWGMNYAADPALKNRHIFPEVDIHLKLSGFRK